jgi:hypothetical protein
MKNELEQHWRRELKAGFCLDPDEAFWQVYRIAKKTKPDEDEFNLAGIHPWPDSWENYSFAMFLDLNKFPSERVWGELESKLRKSETGQDLNDVIIGAHQVRLFVELMRARYPERKKFDFSALGTTSPKVKEIIFWADAHSRPWYQLREVTHPASDQIELINLKRLENQASE